MQPRRARTLRSRRRRDALLGYLLVSPSLVVFVVFVVYPFAKNVWLGLYRTPPFPGLPKRYAALEQYQQILTSQEFLSSLRTTALFVVMTVPAGLALGLLLAVAYMVYVLATLRSIGAFGVIVVAAIFGAGLWVLTDWGVLTLADPSLNLWLGIMVGSLILGIGLSWSILRQRLSGQASVDEIDG